MSEHKKTFTVLGLVAAAVILAVAIFVISQSPGQNDSDTPPGEAAGNIAVGGIESGAQLPGAGIKPEPVIKPEPPAGEPDSGDIPLTVIEEKPEPPTLPDTAHNDDADKPREPITAPALTDPDKKPDSAPKPAETAPPKEQTPNAGDKNGNGEVYIPGFGWVKDEGGGGQGEKSVGEGSLDKIIGY
jgi:hypothetical protein